MTEPQEDYEKEFDEVDGIGAKTAEKIERSGLTWKVIAISSVHDIENRADIGTSKAEDLVYEARQVTGLGGFSSGIDSAARRENAPQIPFLVPEIDQIFNGGIPGSAITEFFGANSSGKSQMVMQMSVNAQLPEPYGPNGGVIFIDAEDTFRSVRIGQMARGLDPEIIEAVLDERGFDYTVEDIKESEIKSLSNPQTPADEFGQSFLNNIRQAQAHNSEQQISHSERAIQEGTRMQTSDDILDPVLIVVDSLTNLFRSEYVGRGELAKRQQKLNKHISRIKEFTEIFQAAAVYTNQVAANPDSYFGDPTQAIGGNIVGHASTYRCYLQELKDPSRKLSLVDAPEFADEQVEFKIVEDGIKPN